MAHEPIAAQFAHPREEADAAASTDLYARRFAGPTGEWMLRMQTDAILSLLDGRPVASVLDMGGGHAQVAPPLARAGHDVTVLISGANAGARLSAARGSFKVTSGDLMAAPFADRSFDAVVSMRMMAHVADWPKYLAELCRMARDTVIVDFPLDGAGGRLGQRLFGAKRLVERGTRRYRLIGRDEVTEVLARHGFDADAHVGQFVLPMALHRMVHKAPLSAVAERVLRPLAPRIGNPVILRAVRRA
ncbi:class I SAM-dependent methyltransferase [Jannaschia rubra]|uniref:Demethylrebeccamycin-D-glucose O-methyltransferase n=1 Tax=Jannaschia rubra TaxID=282197 RepID=A0A0M6XPW6_9RHOB|nr:class I SAM-dependent methyltransferase [Jannaschia rubra]CTQ32702.1 Demethylrebeccamycin-D-glucose O-methyltransferase [Jannaschia rubra]SFF87803.1 Methyltransferase domain-containing protein [Jannaschia rubra]